MSLPTFAKTAAPRCFSILVALLPGLPALAGGESAASFNLEAAVDSAVQGPDPAYSFSGVVLIARNGRPLIRKAYGFADWPKREPLTPESGFMIFSLTKQFTAAAILRLADRGKLSLRDPVARHVTNWPKAWRAVTIHDLLAHASGIDVDTLSFWLFKYHPEFWGDTAGKPPPFVPNALLSKPGTTFRYSNAGYTVLTLIAARVAGRPFPEVMRAEVFGPAGMAHSGLESRSSRPARARGHERSESAVEYREQGTTDIAGAGDLVTTVDDLLSWDEALYDDRFLSSAGRQAMFTPTVEAHLGSFSGRLGYGWLSQDTADGGRRLLHSGRGAGFSGLVIRRPDCHLYFAILTNAPGKSAIHARAADLETAAAAALCGK